MRSCSFLASTAIKKYQKKAELTRGKHPELFLYADYFAVIKCLEKAGETQFLNYEKKTVQLLFLGNKKYIKNVVVKCNLFNVQMQNGCS